MPMKSIYSTISVDTDQLIVSDSGKNLISWISNYSKLILYV